MPALSFIADSTTDQLTIVGHGLVTGNGAAATRNAGGALPAPLVASTDYWVIRIDADHVKLATSSANALAGTAINLTTNGSGANTLEIGIPYRRARTYVAETQVKSVDLNALQDALVSVHDLFTGQPQSVWSSVTLAGGLEVSGSILADGGVLAAPGQHVIVSGAGRHKHGQMTLSIPAAQFVPYSTGSLQYGGTAFTPGAKMISGTAAVAGLTLPVGTRVLAVRFFVQDSATGPTVYRGTIASVSSTGAIVTIAISSNSTGSGANQTLTIGSLTTTIAASLSYVISCENVSGAATSQLYMAEIDYDLP